jgi:hypothetical protein
LPQLGAIDHDAPGQFAFADPDRVRRILSEGWRDIEIEAIDVACTLSAMTSESMPRAWAGWERCFRT